MKLSWGGIPQIGTSCNHVIDIIRCVHHSRVKQSTLLFPDGFLFRPSILRWDYFGGMLHKMLISWLETQNNVEHRVVTIQGNTTIERTFVCPWRVNRFLCGRWRFLTWSGWNSWGRDYLKVGFSRESKDSSTNTTLYVGPHSVHNSRDMMKSDSLYGVYY